MNAVDELNLLLGIGPAKAKLPITLTKSGYTSIKPIGKGGFGQAHLVFQQHTKKYYVVKHINLMQLSPRQRKDAHNEIHILQSLTHPNIIRYEEYSQEHPNLYIMMEYADGGDLAGHIDKLKKARQRLSEDQLVNLFAQISLALKYLHDRRILHRDIKGANVFLTKSHVVKLGDFGISTVLQSTSAMAKTMAGTPVSFSPEICEGKLYNNKSDVWSLAVLLYEMATCGSLPFDGKDMKTLMKNIITKDAPHLPSHYSKSLDDLFQWMLKKDPAERPDIIQVLRHPAVASRVASVTSQLEMFTSRPASAANVPQQQNNNSSTNRLNIPNNTNRVYASNSPAMDQHQNNNNNSNNNNANHHKVAAAAANINLPPRPVVSHQQQPQNQEQPTPQPPPRKQHQQPQQQQPQVPSSSIDPVVNDIRANKMADHDRAREKALEEFRRKKQEFKEQSQERQKSEERQPPAGVEKKNEDSDINNKKKNNDQQNYGGHMYDDMQYVMLADSPPAPPKSKANVSSNQNNNNIVKVHDDGIRVAPLTSQNKKSPVIAARSSVSPVRGGGNNINNNNNNNNNNNPNPPQQYVSPGSPEELYHLSASYDATILINTTSNNNTNDEADDQLARVIDELRETALDEKEMKAQAAAARKANQEEDEQHAKNNNQTETSTRTNNNREASIVIDVTEATPSPKKNREGEEQGGDTSEVGNKNNNSKKQPVSSSAFFEDAHGTAVDVKTLIENAKQNINNNNGNVVIPQQASSTATDATTTITATNSCTASSTSAPSFKVSCLCSLCSLTISHSDIIGSFVCTDEIAVRSSGNPNGVEYLHLPDFASLDQLLDANNNNTENSAKVSNLKKFSMQQSDVESYFCSECGTRLCLFNVSGAKGCCVPRGVVVGGKHENLLRDFTFSP